MAWFKIENANSREVLATIEAKTEEKALEQHALNTSFKGSIWSNKQGDSLFIKKIPKPKTVA